MKSEIQKIFWAVNLKFLRQRKKLSVESLAENLGISRAKLTAHENGHTKNPPAEDLLTTSDFFKISIDSLLKVDLAKLGELKMRDLEAGNDVYKTGGNIRVLTISVDSHNRENVEYVPVKAKAGYRAGYSDPEFIASLPKFNFPNLSRNETYRMFPTTGDSMLPIPEGSDILAKYVQDWTNIKRGTLCIVILKGDQDFVFKKVTIKEKEVVFESLNKAYKPYSEPVSNIIEIWEYERFISDNLPAEQTEFSEIKDLLLELRRSLKK